MYYQDYTLSLAFQGSPRPRQDQVKFNPLAQLSKRTQSAAANRMTAPLLASMARLRCDAPQRARPTGRGMLATRMHWRSRGQRPTQPRGALLPLLQTRILLARILTIDAPCSSASDEEPRSRGSEAGLTPAGLASSNPPQPRETKDEKRGGHEGPWTQRGHLDVSRWPHLPLPRP